MAINRYSRTPIINGGRQLGTAQAASIVKQAVDAGQLSTTVLILQGAERLDTIAGRTYGDSRNWWIIAAASGIGWALQVPTGTRLVVPTDLSQVAELVG